MDIIYLDSEIRKKFQDEKEKLPEYESELDRIERYLKVDILSIRIINALKGQCKSIKEKIDNIENDTELYIYEAKTAEIIHRYKELLEKPIKMSFMDEAKRNAKQDTEKQKLLNQFLSVAKTNLGEDFYIGNTKTFEIKCEL